MVEIKARALYSKVYLIKHSIERASPCCIFVHIRKKKYLLLLEVTVPLLVRAHICLCLYMLMLRHVGTCLSLYEKARCQDDDSQGVTHLDAAQVVFETESP